MLESFHLKSILPQDQTQTHLRSGTDAQGQATVEYILMLSVSVTIALIVIKNFISPVYTEVASRVAQSVENRLSGANLYHFRVGK